ELHGLLPALVAEQHDGEIVFALELEVDLRADPLGGAVHYLPHHALVGMQLENLQVEAAEQLAVDEEAGGHHAAPLLVDLGLGGPPGGDAFGRRQGLVDLVQRRLDSYAMQNVEHDASP